MADIVLNRSKGRYSVHRISPPQRYKLIFIDRAASIV